MLSSLSWTPICRRDRRRDRPANQLRPGDFEPLTELPWESPGATLERVLDRIFREPNPTTRYPVLAEYLRTIPGERLADAFDRSIANEGTQTPDDLVEFLLEIWARRGPQACWDRTKQLFHVVGIEEGWLGYDDWGTQPRIKVRDLHAIQRSPFWLRRDSLLSFPWGVNDANVPEEEHVKIPKEFADLWLTTFKSWPGYDRPARSQSSQYSDGGAEFVRSFRMTDKETRAFLQQPLQTDAGAVEVAMRRALKSDPASGRELIQLRRDISWSKELNRQDAPGLPSTEFLDIWSQVDLAAAVKWADSLDIGKDHSYGMFRGFLMNRIDAATRARWLAQAAPDAAGEGPGDLINLLSAWAASDPEPAVDAALATGNLEIIQDVLASAVPSSPALNSTHFGIGFIKRFDLSRLPEKIRENHFLNWEEFLEAWGDIDIGETARYGFDFLLRTDYAPRENLIKYFSGIDGFTDDAMADRTFCSLRVWSVVRPEEMEAWIKTVENAEMRNALCGCSLIRGAGVRNPVIASDSN
jgi:hypothetical protein